MRQNLDDAVPMLMSLFSLAATRRADGNALITGKNNAECSGRLEGERKRFQALRDARSTKAWGGR